MEPEIQGELNRDKTGICKLILKFIASCVMVFLALWIQIYVGHAFITQQVPKMIQESPDKAKLFKFLGGLVCCFDLMSIWSLLTTFLSNPGFVGDYYKSV